MNIPKGPGSGARVIVSKSDARHGSSDATLFSCSLPVLPHEKLNGNNSESYRQSIDDITPGLNKPDQGIENSLEDVAIHAIGSLLPDDEEELLAGIMGDLDLTGLPASLDDLEEDDVFGSGGGMELEIDTQYGLNRGMPKVTLSDAAVENGMSNYGIQNGVGTVAGEHPYGEHPSRTLFVRNINSNVEDLELRALFEQYGDIRTMYTACKHRGFVMISYYDIRAARTAMRALQNKPLRRRKLDIHFSIPKDNPSEKDINQGTLVVFNLDPSVSSEDLRQIFGAYGEVKEIRETPHKRHHKFIEYYDVRAAEAALKALNRSDIAGKRIKLEPSRPGGARRNLMFQLNQELEQDDSRSYLHQVGSPLSGSSPGNWLLNSPIEHNPLHNISKSPVFRTISPKGTSNLPGLASILHSQGSSSAKVAPIGMDQGRVNHLEHLFSSNNTAHGAAFQQSHSLPEPKLGQYHGTVSSFGSSNSNSTRLETLSGSQFLWGSPNPFSGHASSSSAWLSSSMVNQLASNGRSHGFPYSARQNPLQQYHHHQVGSAPSGAPFESHFGFFPESSDASLGSHGAFGGQGIGPRDGKFMMNMGIRSGMNSGIGIPRNTSETGTSSFRMINSPGLSPVFLSNGMYPRLDVFSEMGKARRVENNVNQEDSKKLFQLDLDKIVSGEDTRTTLMIKNIPNKYTSKMLLAAIDEKNKGTYDFLYLPIDFKNKCNVGYAFINMLSPKHIIPFYKAFNGKKWEKFNSEKVASLAYARIQGKSALVAHFQNSSLMNEDKRCRPIVFHSDAPESADQEQLQSATLNAQVSQPNVLHSEDTPGIPTKNGGDLKADQS